MRATVILALLSVAPIYADESVPACGFVKGLSGKNYNEARQS